jgi:HK97 family phage portal protein
MDNPASNWRQNRVQFVRGENASEYIATWATGQEQARPHDVRRYAEDGYSKNSLIYSCVKEKATSFASLRPILERPDGTVVRDHRVARLLMDPNPYQDGQEFAELAKTQFEVAGNCYIEKRRQTADRDRRERFAQFPVQELHLIRPDYVSIQPGATRMLDMFVVTIEGQVRRRIPRADMIHIAEPNLVNDFYGLPKIALLTREGDIDLSMSDFELSFFRNAGVPMGLLKVKGNKSTEEREEIKSLFRKAYNGVRHWFDLLVLNADAAEYQQLGLPQSQMESETTRFHIESRICSVFGVPGVIVGARFALQGAQQPIEEAEHQFWSETMVPDAMRFGRAFTKFLLPEFATSADRDAVMGYDFTVVRALQEDRSRKMREVVRMILTGGFTVNQALQSMGLPAQTNGDFYVRNGSHVIVDADGTITPMMQPDGEAAPNPDNPLEGSARMDEAAAVREAERLTIFRRPE